MFAFFAEAIFSVDLLNDASFHFLFCFLSFSSGSILFFVFFVLLNLFWCSASLFPLGEGGVVTIYLYLYSVHEASSKEQGD